VVLVVGETARSANWGLSGYARQTTPQLAERCR
jgi:lipid A ethanolaminephosphotransferase